MRKKLIGLFLFACVTAALMIPALGLSQQRGDPAQQGVKGGKKGKGGQGDAMPGQGGTRGTLNIGGMNIDANAIFDQLAKGQDSILISNAGQMATPLQQWALDNGNTSGRVNRQQFSGFVQTYAASLQAGAGAAKGKGAKGGDPDAAIVQRFKGVDKNGDGFISQDEMSAQARDTGVWKKYDLDGDGRLNLEEYKNFSRDKAVADQALKMTGGGKGTQGLYEAMVGMNEARTEKVENTDWEKRPVVYRRGKLPDNLPAWFIQLDVDKDCQIGLYEWRASQKPIVEFQVMDRNGDSLLTPEEVLWHIKTIASLNGPGMTTASYSQALQGIQGFPSGGFGGFNSFGKGGGKKGDSFGGFGGSGGKKGKKGGGGY